MSEEQKEKEQLTIPQTWAKTLKSQYLFNNCVLRHTLKTREKFALPFKHCLLTALSVLYIGSTTPPHTLPTCSPRKKSANAADGHVTWERICYHLAVFRASVCKALVFYSTIALDYALTLMCYASPVCYSTQGNKQQFWCSITAACCHSWAGITQVRASAWIAFVTHSEDQ